GVVGGGRRATAEPRLAAEPVLRRGVRGVRGAGGVLAEVLCGRVRPAACDRRLSHRPVHLLRQPAAAARGLAVRPVRPAPRDLLGLHRNGTGTDVALLTRVGRGGGRLGGHWPEVRRRLRYRDRQGVPTPTPP